MPELLKNILWMAEELDFQASLNSKQELQRLATQFIDLTANKEFNHYLYRS